MKSPILATIAVLVFAASLCAAPATLPVGTRVQFDKVYANDPSLSQWVEGEITGYMPAQNYYKLRSTAGVNYTIPNDPRWIRPAGEHAAPSTPGQGGSPTPSGTNPSRPTPGKPPVPVGGYAAGTRVRFDRVEALVPANSVWDTGVIVARVANNRYKIRGDNDIIYTIQDDPRWIAPAGTPIPAPRNTPSPGPQVKPNPPVANGGAMPPDGIYNVTNLGALHSVGELQIRGASYRGLAVEGPFKPLRGTGASLDFSGGLAGLEGCRITGANFMGLSKIGQPVIKIRYVSPNGFNEELEATKEH